MAEFSSLNGYTCRDDVAREDIAELQSETATLRTEVDTLNDGGLNLKDTVIRDQIDNWLDDHPEATTTVQDGSITEAKLSRPLFSEVDTLKEDLNEVDFRLSESITEILNVERGSVSSTFVVGGVNADGNEIVTSSYVRSDYIPLDGMEILYTVPNSGYKYVLRFFDANKTYLKNHVGQDMTTNSMKINLIGDDAKYVRVVVGKSNGQNPIIEEGKNVVVSYDYPLVRKVNEIEAIKNVTSYDLMNESTWEKGTISVDTGLNITTSSLIRSGFVGISDTIKTVLFTIKSGYKYNYFMYDENMEYIGAGHESYILKDKYIALPKNVKYLRFRVASNTSTDGNVAWKDNLSVSGDSPILSKLKDLENAESIGNGDYYYTGEKIVLGDYDKKFKCDISVWKDFYGSNIPNLASYQLHLNQSIAVFGKYMFLFNDGGNGCVVEMDSKNIISTFTTSEPSNHQNAVQFSNIYYDLNDEFPLLFMSQCSNAPSDKCIIYRVTRSGTTFTFTVINRIKIGATTYTTSFAIDNNNKTLTAETFLNGTFSVSSNNPIRFFTWKMPKKAEIISGTEIELRLDDAIYESAFDHATPQQVFGKSGFIYAGIQPDNGGRCVYVFDVENGVCRTKVDLLDSSSELEGVCIHNGKLYVTQKRNTDSSAVHPLTIYELNF